MSVLKMVDENSFKAEVLENDSLVIVDFSAEWCGPCKKQLPVLEKFATENPLVKVVKVDIDDSPHLASKYGIRSIPSLMLFNKGEKLTAKVGLTSSNELTKLVELSKIQFSPVNKE